MTLLLVVYIVMSLSLVTLAKSVVIKWKKTIRWIMYSMGYMPLLIVYSIVSNYVTVGDPGWSFFRLFLPAAAVFSFQIFITWRLIPLDVHGGSAER